MQVEKDKRQEVEDKEGSKIMIDQLEQRFKENITRYKARMIIEAQDIEKRLPKQEKLSLKNLPMHILNIFRKKSHQPT